MIEVDNLQLIGEFFVDSGQAIVGDPCYLDEWQTWNSDSEVKFEEHKNRAGEYGYLGSANATLSKQGYGVLSNGKAIAFTTGYGDGLYPVYAELNSEGYISKIIIDFEDEEVED